MKVTRALGVAVALALVVGCARAGREEPESGRDRQAPSAAEDGCELAGLVAPPARTESERLFAVPSLGGEFFEVDPRTLRPLSARRAQLKAHVAFADPAGFRLIDTRSWKVKTVDTEASFLHRAGDAVFATVEATESTGGRVCAYGFDGELRFELAASGPVWVSESAAGYVYIGEDEGRRYRRIDAASGGVRQLETGARDVADRRFSGRLTAGRRS